MITSLGMFTFFGGEFDMGLHQLTASPMEGHLFVVGWISILPWGGSGGELLVWGSPWWRDESYAYQYCVKTWDAIDLFNLIGNALSNRIKLQMFSYASHLSSIVDYSLRPLFPR